GLLWEANSQDDMAPRGCRMTPFGCISRVRRDRVSGRLCRGALLLSLKGIRMTILVKGFRVARSLSILLEARRSFPKKTLLLATLRSMVQRLGKHTFAAWPVKGSV